MLLDRRLSVPRAWLVHPESARPVERLALAGAPARACSISDTIPAHVTIGLAIAAADDAPAPSERPALLYNRFLVAGADSTADGLIRRAFEPGSPYEGEALFLAPPQGRASLGALPRLGRRPQGCALPCLAEAAPLRSRRAGAPVPATPSCTWSRIVAAGWERLTTPQGG